MQNLTNAKITAYIQSDITMQTSVKSLRAVSMCSAFTFGETKAFLFFWGRVLSEHNVFGWNSRGENVFPIFWRSANQCLHCSSAWQWQVRNFASKKNKQYGFSRILAKGYFFFWRDAKIDSICYWRRRLSSVPQMKNVFTFQAVKFLAFTTVNFAKPALLCWITLLKTKNPAIVLFGGGGTHCFARKTNRGYTNKKPYPFLKIFLRQSQSATPEPEQKAEKTFNLWHNRVESSLVDAPNWKFNPTLILHTFSVQRSNMILSVSDDGFDWFIDVVLLWR